MKKLVILTVGIAGCVFLWTTYANWSGYNNQIETANKNSSSSSLGGSAELLVEENDITFFQPADRSYNLIKLRDPQLEFAWQPREENSLKRTADLKKWQVAINGGYFIDDGNGIYPAGLLQIKGNLVSNVVSGSTQVTQVLIFDHQTNEFTHQPVDKFNLVDYGSENFSLLQTGPLIVNQGRLTTGQIQKSLNGEEQALRSLIGYDKEFVYFINSRSNVNLESLGNKILASGQVNAAAITLINLDGGTSTAMYNQVFDELNFGENKHLPGMIGIF